MTSNSGPAVARASLSPRQAKALGLLTSDTSGLHGTGSSKSVALQSSLASRLQAETQSLGSTLYRLTWKTWAMPSGRMLVRQRASAHRTSETAAIGAGWPTPTTRDWKDGANPNVDVPLNALLGRVVWLAGWPTPTVGNATGSQMAKGASPTGRRPDGTKATVSLPQVASFAGWPTPVSRDHFPAHSAEYIAAKKAQGHGMSNLNDVVVHQVSGAARFTASGQMLTGSDAGMESGGPLNPAHSRWLMGYPTVWCACAPTATRSTRTKARRSSGHS